MKSTKFTCVFPKFNKVNNCRYIYTKSNRKITILYKKSLLFQEPESHFNYNINKGFIVKVDNAQNYIKIN